MKKTLKNIQKTSTVKPLDDSKALAFKGGRYIPPPKPVTKPGNNQ
ncbi:MAG: hypothetical protein ACPG49_07550 [Chitinophagales bacterium]